MATLKARLLALEGTDDGLEILNPRFYDYDGPLTEAEFEAENAERIAAAVRAGKRIIRLQPLRDFAE